MAMTQTSVVRTAPRRRGWIKVAALVLFVGGFLVGFGASGWQGMAILENPGALALNLALWALGVALEWWSDEHTAVSSESRWRRALSFVGRGSSTWLLLGIMFGFTYFPSVSTSYIGTNFNLILAVTLAVMGIQITLQAWKDLVRDVRPIIVVVLMRWILMPLIGYAISYLFFHPWLDAELAQQLAIGMILLATSPTGAASNSLTYISKGDLALSVSATTVNVLVAPFLQPLLVHLMAGSATSVDAGGMFLDLVKFVLLPVLIASVVGILLPRFVVWLKPALPAVAVLTLAFVLMGTISKGTETILSHLAVMGFVLAACVVHGCLGMTLGYTLPRFLPKPFRLAHPQRVAAAFEVGVENAAIAPSLAISFFSPLAIVPAVVYGKTQNLLAVTVFAPYFARRAERLEIEEARLLTAKAPAATA